MSFAIVCRTAAPRNFLLASRFPCVRALIGYFCRQKRSRPAPDQLPPIEGQPAGGTRTRTRGEAPSAMMDIVSRRTAPNVSQTGIPARYTGRQLPTSHLQVTARPTGNSPVSSALLRTVITADDPSRHLAGVHPCRKIIAQGARACRLNDIVRRRVNGVGDQAWTCADFGAFRHRQYPRAHQRPQTSTMSIWAGRSTFSTIPRDSIERIEITRGNSGAVLYGDKRRRRASSNIVTKTGVKRSTDFRCAPEARGWESFSQRQGRGFVDDKPGDPGRRPFFGNGNQL